MIFVYLGFWLLFSHKYIVARGEKAYCQCETFYRQPSSLQGAVIFVWNLELKTLRKKFLFCIDFKLLTFKLFCNFILSRHVYARNTRMWCLGIKWKIPLSSQILLWLKRIFFVIIPSQQQCTDCRDTCSLVSGWYGGDTHLL